LGPGYCTYIHTLLAVSVAAGNMGPSVAIYKCLQLPGCKVVWESVVYGASTEHNIVQRFAGRLRDKI
jgi:hypothetical protein